MCGRESFCWRWSIKRMRFLQRTHKELFVYLTKEWEKHINIYCFKFNRNINRWLRWRAPNIPVLDLGTDQDTNWMLASTGNTSLEVGMARENHIRILVLSFPIHCDRNPWDLHRSQIGKMPNQLASCGLVISYKTHMFRTFALPNHFCIEKNEMQQCCIVWIVHRILVIWNNWMLTICLLDSRWNQVSYPVCTIRKCDDGSRCLLVGMVVNTEQLSPPLKRLRLVYFHYVIESQQWIASSTVK